MITVKNLRGAAGVGSVRRAAPTSPTRQMPPSFLWLTDDRHQAAVFTSRPCTFAECDPEPRCRSLETPLRGRDESVLGRRPQQVS